VIEAVLDGAPEQPLGERGAALEGQRVGQQRLEVDGFDLISRIGRALCCSLPRS